MSFARRLAPLAALLLLSSCAGSAAASPTPSELPSPSPTPLMAASWTETTETTGFADEESGTPLLEAKLSVPKAGGQAVTPAQEWISDYYEAELEKLRDEAEELSARAQEDFTYFRTEGTEFHTYALEASYELTLNTPQYASFLRTHYYYGGGAHGEITLTGDTFDMSAGARLELGNLFTVPEEEYLPRLLAEVDRQLKAHAENDGWPVWTEEEMQSAFDPACFYLTPEGLTVYYQLYSLGPYALGTPEFPIERAVLEDILISW